MQALRLAAAQRTSALSGTPSLRRIFGGLTAQMAPQTTRWTTGEAHAKLTDYQLFLLILLLLIHRPRFKATPVVTTAVQNEPEGPRCRTFKLNRERAVDYLNMLDRIYVFDGFAGWEQEASPFLNRQCRSQCCQKGRHASQAAMLGRLATAGG